MKKWILKFISWFKADTNSDQEVSDEEKIRQAVERGIREYGPALKKLGSE